MKKMQILAGIFLMTLSTTVLRAEAASGHCIVNLYDLNDRMIEAFFTGENRDLILECQEGALLPCTLGVTGDFLSLEAAEPLYMRVLSTCYVRCNGQNHFLFSADLEEWKPFMEFFTGTVNLSLSTESGAPMAGLQLELKARDSACVN